MFGDDLKKWRKERKLTQAQLGELIGVTGAYIQQLELGKKKNPSLEIVIKLCSALKIAPFDLDYDFNDDEYCQLLMNKSRSENVKFIAEEDKEILENLGYIKDGKLVPINEKRKNNDDYISIPGGIFQKPLILNPGVFYESIATICYYVDNNFVNLNLSDEEYKDLGKKIKELVEFELFKISKNKNDNKEK